MKFFLLTLLQLLALNLLSQEGQGISLPTIIPPSPEVGKLTEAGKLSTGLHSGSANVNIPIFSFKVNSAGINIALSYNSNGIKVDDIPSRVGLGWNLVAGGVVSRVIHNQPDDGTAPFLNPPSNPYNQNGELLTYLQAVTQPLPAFDTEWDEYSYSFNGMSGRFFLDENGNGVSMPHSNVKIKVFGFNSGTKYFEITAPDGIKYTFGSLSKETTRSINIQGGATGNVIKNAAFETSWFLDRVNTPEGGVIDFNYSSVDIVTQTGKYQTLIKPLIVNPLCPDQPGVKCNYSESSGTNVIEYTTKILESIISENVTVNFFYENRPDVSGDKRLTSVVVHPNDILNPVKSLIFEYETPGVNNNSWNKRFFLKKVKDNEVSATGQPSIDHEFGYDDINGMPERLSYGQDWYGYNNGQTNNPFFAPLIPSIVNLVEGGGNGGNRNPGTLEQMKKGSLLSIKYPTGATESFEYEPHTISQNIGTPAMEIASTNGSGIGTNSPWLHTSNTFTATSDQQATIFLTCNKSPAFPDAPSGEGDKIYQLNVKETATGTIVFTRFYRYYSSEQFTLNLQANKSYKLELTIWGEVNAGSVNVHFNQATNYSYQNVPVGGIRVKSIKAFDPVSNKNNNRYFSYAYPNDFSKSSGVGPFFPTMYEQYINGPAICYPGTFQVSILKCNTYLVSSGGINQAYSFAGSNVGYASVIESNDPLFNNGFTQHQFHTSYPAIANPNIIMGTSPLGTPVYMDTDLNGMELQTTIFKKSTTGDFMPLREVINNYVISDQINQSRTSYIARHRFVAVVGVTSPPNSTIFDGFDLVKYNYNSKWVQLASTTEKNFDEKGENPVTVVKTFSYDNITHLQPTKETVNNSKNETFITEYKYPADFATTTPVNVYQKMVNQHKLQEKIEIRKYKTSVLEPNLHETIQTEFKDWYNDGKIIAPEWIKTKFKGNSNWDNRLQYPQYDIKGNPLEVRKVNDISESYIWGYNRSLPIAKVAGSSYTKIAFTSFEDNEKGNWTYSGSPIQGSPVFTGTKSYNLSAGAITKSITETGNYFISYWSKAGQATIAGSTVTSQVAIDGWTFYEHKINIAAPLVLAVSSATSLIIDELRMYPENSLMTTLTHKPFIGVSTQNDPTNQVLSYAYDGFNRLLIVRNRNGEILKQYAYKYQETVSGILSTTPNWVATSVERCVQVPPNNNYTGYLEREEKDMNPASSTYLQPRYISTNPSATCTPIDNCTGLDKRVVVGIGCETGKKEFYYSTLQNGFWECKYYYIWSDGFRSPDYMGYNGSSCIGDPQ